MGEIGGRTGCRSDPGRPDRFDPWRDPIPVREPGRGVLGTESDVELFSDVDPSSRRSMCVSFCGNGWRLADPFGESIWLPPISLASEMFDKESSSLVCMSLESGEFGGRMSMLSAGAGAEKARADCPPWVVSSPSPSCVTTEAGTVRGVL